MKKKDFKELRNKEVKDITKILLEKKANVAEIEPNVRAGKEKNLKKVNNLKREIAQILTLLKEKEIEAKEGKK